MDFFQCKSSPWLKRSYLLWFGSLYILTEFYVTQLPKYIIMIEMTMYKVQPFASFRENLRKHASSVGVHNLLSITNQ